MQVLEVKENGELKLLIDRVDLQKLHDGDSTIKAETQSILNQIS